MVQFFNGALTCLGPFLKDSSLCGDSLHHVPDHLSYALLRDVLIYKNSYINGLLFETDFDLNTAVEF
jgi:hypothetical protein